jgi:hypothetical protein
MSSESFSAFEFQKCTIDHIRKQFLQRGRFPKRFLVADEVGLGKTIIARHTISNVTAGKKQSVCLYICSNLEIAKQNKFKLVKNANQIFTVDRINLLFEKPLPKTRDVHLLAITPETSIFLRNGLGSKNERLYLAYYIHKVFGYSKSVSARILAGRISKTAFLKELEAYRDVHPDARLPGEQFRAHFEREFRRIRPDTPKRFSLIERNQYQRRSSKVYNQLAKDLRAAFAAAVLSDLRPSVIVLDEFQKYRKVLDEADSDTVLKRLFNKTVPTVLLSATPYKLFVANDEQNSVQHYDDLKQVFSFLLGDPQKANQMIEGIVNYGIRLLKVDNQSIAELLRDKAAIEKQVLRVMSRAERISFEHSDAPSSETIHSTDDASARLTAGYLSSFLRMSDLTNQRGVWLTYWKSGDYPLSYMRNYKLVENMLGRLQSEAPQKIKGAYSGESGANHPKLRYLQRDLFGDGRAFDYLWLPPSRPYYQGGGIFSEKQLSHFNPKKGLIFSSWKFAPRFFAAEVNKLRQRDIAKYSVTSNALRATTHNWARFYFPSPLLSSTLVHADFLESQSYKQLLRLAYNRLKSRLETDFGFRIDKKATTSFWKVIAQIDLKTNEQRKHNLIEIYSGRKANKFKQKDQPVEQPVPPAELDRILAAGTETRISPLQILELAKITIASPAVSILRFFESVYSRPLEEKEYAALAMFCIFNLKNFVNRETNIAVMEMVHGKNKREAKTNIGVTRRKNHAHRAQEYFRNGNIQAVFDEYLYLLSAGHMQDAVNVTLRDFAAAIAPRSGGFRVPQAEGKDRLVRADIAVAFGDSDIEGDPHGNLRTSFNSPFWPFSLATTSVGQEGLDFHLYCKDIYHWNLPSNPVDFEQREGRINRFNNLMIRENMVKTAQGSRTKFDGFFWADLLSAKGHLGHYHNRYNLGLSPNWIFTTFSEGGRQRICRHILQIPLSKDHARFDALMRDLDTYRLALGQPNQKKYLEKLNTNKFLKENVVNRRGLILNFFPFSANRDSEKFNSYLASNESVRGLLSDCQKYAADMGIEHRFPDLWQLLVKNISLVQASIETEPLPKSLKQNIKALYHFVNPHDETSDDTPVIGFDDDIRALRDALKPKKG